MNFKHLISENGSDASIGRVSFWIVFAIIIWYWIRAGLTIDITINIPDIPQSLEYIFYSLLLYNSGKKFTGVLEKRNANREK